MEAVRRALFNDFANWKIDNKDHVSHLDDEERVDVYMNETYAMSPGDGNLFETIKEMNSPPMDEDRDDLVAVTNDIITCSKKRGNRTGQTKQEFPQATRKKRSDEGENVNFQGFLSLYRANKTNLNIWAHMRMCKHFTYSLSLLVN